MNEESHKWGEYKDASGQFLSGRDIRAAVSSYDLTNGNISILMKLWRLDYGTAIALIKDEYKHVHATQMAIF